MQFGGSGSTSGRQGQWFQYHDNSPSHTSLVEQQFLANKNIPVITHRNLWISFRVTFSSSLL
jgi:hypothetical protein